MNEEIDKSIEEKTENNQENTIENNVENIAENNIDKNLKKDVDNKEDLYKDYKKIDYFFKAKEEYIKRYKHIALEDILANAPKHYAFINFIERINIFLSKDSLWLKHFVDKNKIHFDYNLYERWKLNKKFSTQNYSQTQAPSKWIHVLQDYFIELLESLQILLVIQYHIKDEDYKNYLKANPQLYFKLRANFTRPSLPSEDIEKFFDIIDYLLNLNIQYDFLTKLVVDASLCMQVYRYIDKSKIFDLIKQKEFYIKFRLDFLKKTKLTSRVKLPYEEDVINVADRFLEKAMDLRFTYKEFKNRLIEKYNKFNR